MNLRLIVCMIALLAGCDAGTVESDNRGRTTARSRPGAADAIRGPSSVSGKNIDAGGQTTSDINVNLPPLPSATPVATSPSDSPEPSANPTSSAAATTPTPNATNAAPQTPTPHPTTASTAPASAAPTAAPTQAPDAPDIDTADPPVTSLRQATPAYITVPQTNSAAGTVMTWDGRVIIKFPVGDIDPDVTRKWAIKVFRPENLGRDAANRPVFGDTTFSRAVPFRLNDAAPDADHVLEIGATGHLAIAQNQTLAQNPYVSDAAGNPIDGAPPHATRYLTYDFYIYTMRHPFGEGPHPVSNAFGLRRARIVVIDPGSPTAAVSDAYMVESWRPLSFAGAPFPGNPANELRGIEPSMTADGRMLVWQGNRNNDGSIGQIMYAWNQAPNQADGWTMPKPMHYIVNDRDILVQGVPLQRRFPIAQQLFRDVQGTFFGIADNYDGAYPWISPDGSELFSTTFNDHILADANGNTTRRAGMTAIGRATNWAMRLLDGPINEARYGRRLDGHPGIVTSPLLFTGPGAFHSRWAAWGDVPDLKLDYLKRKFAYPLFGFNTQSYQEVDFDDYLDRHYVAYYHMNELMLRGPAADGTNYRPAPGYTADSSGNLDHGALIGGAAFPQEYPCDDQGRCTGPCPLNADNPCLQARDRNIGIVGQAILFPDGGAVVVDPRADDGFASITTAISVQMFVKRMRDIGQGRSLIFRDQQFQLAIESDGRLTATVVLRGGQVVRSGPVGPVLPIGTWSHVGFTYEGNYGGLWLFVDGRLVSAQNVAKGAVNTVGARLVIGPAIANSTFGPTAIFALDEVAISNTVRGEADFRAAAYMSPAVSQRGVAASSLEMPLGTAAVDLYDVKQQMRPDVVALGRLLFFDKLMSADLTRSCATCHDPARAFTDGRPVGVGLGNRAGLRNTPTLVNRGTAREQMLDGRSPNLEQQAFLPLENPNEMGLLRADAVTRLNANANYVALFRRAFGGPPTANRLAVAIAAFERTIRGGNSRVDRFEAGDARALTASEARGRALFHGKAFCASCHLGPNYTDELFHNLDFFVVDPNDGGRSNVTFRYPDHGAFKTPSLRNVALTGPYTHNGSVPTLEAMVDHYTQGGIVSSSPGRSLEIFPLDLTAGDKADIVAFLRALTGEVRTGLGAGELVLPAP